MFDMYGCAPQEFVPTMESWREKIVADDWPLVSAQLQAAIDGNDHYRTDFRIHRSNGETRYIHAEGVVERDPGGSGVRMIGVNVDLTSQKTAEIAAAERLVAL